ncbi:MAG TPA: hypothetical protein VEM96_02785 [Pyrinomonadaceae bacterium]|nr:hypothetical protein [Pyrinomonadaceae bacterium]
MTMFVFGQKLYHQEPIMRNAERDLDLECGGERSATASGARRRIRLAPEI